MNISFGVRKDKEHFIEQMAVLMDSGMDVLTAVESVRMEMRSYKMKFLLGEIQKMVDRGESLWSALDKTGILPQYFVSIIRIGEQSGTLVNNLKMLSLQCQKDKAFKSKIGSAIIYPLIVAIVSIVVGLLTAIFILPRISGVLTSLGVDPPLVTKVIIWLGTFIEEHGVIAIPSFILVMIITSFLLFINKGTKHIGEKLMLKFPGIKKVLIEIEISRFGYILGSLINAGVPIVDALDLLEDMATFRIYKKFYKYLKESVEKGKSFKESFLAYKDLDKFFPFTFQKLIVTAEQSGNLENMLLKVGGIYEDKLEVTSKNLTVILEPVLLMFVWVGVAVLAIGIVVPIYSLVGGINTEADSPGTDSLVNEGVSEAEENFDEEDDTNPEVLEDLLDEDGNEDEESAKTSEFPPESPDSSTAEDSKSEFIKIKSTGVGYLNVRSVPGGTIVDKVYPDEEYKYTETSQGWYKITLKSGDFGWVSGEYVDEI